MLSVKVAYFLLFICRGDLKVCFTHHGAICIMGQQFFGNESHIIGSCIMVFIVETICGDEVRVFAAKFFCTFCHMFCKCFYGTIHIFCNAVGSFIGRTQYDRTKHLLQSQRFTFLNGNVSTALFDGINSIMGEGDLVCEFSVFQSEQDRHQFCNAGRKHFLVSFLVI